MYNRIRFGTQSVSLGMVLTLLVCMGSVFPAQAASPEERVRALEQRSHHNDDPQNSVAWWKKFKPMGDFRIRHENLIREGDNASLVCE